MEVAVVGRISGRVHAVLALCLVRGFRVVRCFRYPAHTCSLWGLERLAAVGCGLKPVDTLGAGSRDMNPTWGEAQQGVGVRRAVLCRLSVDGERHSAGGWPSGIRVRLPPAVGVVCRGSGSA